MEIYDLADIPKSRYFSVGGKARGLNALSMAGLEIPGGFVITDIENEDDLEKIADFYIESGLDLVAVRSSATGEDGTDFSNAGQFSSFLNITGREQLKTAVKKCLDSLNNKTATSYAANFKQAGNSKMSVVIQQMINAEKSGVCFTKDPLIENKHMLIEAVPGPGEKLVSGNAIGSRYLIPVDKQFSRDVLNSKHADSSKNDLLSAGNLANIFEQAKTISNYLDIPLDTEWSIDKNGQLYWLQARPITTLNEPGIDELDVSMDVKNNIITSCNISEMLPGAVTPLSLSTSVYAIDYGMRKMFVHTGVFKNMKDVPPESFALSVCNHLFLNLNTIYRMADCVLGASREAAELSICGRVLKDMQKPDKKNTNILVKINNCRKYFMLLLSRKKACNEIKKLAKEFIISDNDDPWKLYKEISNSLMQLNHSFWLHYITSGHSGAMVGALFQIIDADTSDNEETRSIIASLLENIEGIESADILTSLHHIADALLKEDPSIKELSNKEILHYIKTCRGDIKSKYDSFIGKHGHRSICEAEVRNKGWNRDEINLMDRLRPVLVSEKEEAQNCSSINSKILELPGEYKGFKKGILKYLIKQARDSVKNRELSKSMCIKVLDQFKIAYARLAEQSVQKGILPDEDLIYFLQHEEIGELLNKNKHTLVKKAIIRRRLFSEQQMLKFQDIYIGKPVPLKNHTQVLEDKTILNGSPGSRGLAEGIARVVKSIGDANKLEKGEIMIAAFTDIGWSPYYCLIGALVTEIGSVLSHGVVVAREYALPMVTNAAGATQLIHTGDRVIVDGTKGTVTILSRTNKD